MAAGGLEHQDRRAGRRRLADHVGGIGRHHDGVGEGEQRDIGVVARPVPEEAAMARDEVAAGPSRRAGGVRREAVIISAGAGRGERVEVGEEAGGVLAREAVVAAVAAGEHGDARPGQSRRGAGPGSRAGRREALRRDPVRRGERGDDVRPAQPVVLRHPDQVGACRRRCAGP